jgi:ATP-dependent exoDNAse (exonuclease V) alpha subunit
VGDRSAWSTEHRFDCTAPRFKGLESPIVFVWGIDKVDPSVDRELLYVSLSRAKSELYLVSTPAVCALIKSHIEDLHAITTVGIHS